ncbi:MAG: hypothetical protein RLZZ340_669, partial [Actinomycetota bacterium]
LNFFFVSVSEFIAFNNFFLLSIALAKYSAAASQFATPLE